jgi:hypothetical protein
MNPQRQADIIEQLRLILVQEGDDSEILAQARIALSDWFITQYPHLSAPHPPRNHLHLVKGEGRCSNSLARQAPLLSVMRMMTP